MHDTGIVRRVDDLGRIVIPMELRRTMNIRVKDPISIFVEDDKIILMKYQSSCVVCGDADVETKEFKGRPVCQSCVDTIKAG